MSTETEVPVASRTLNDMKADLRPPLPRTLPASRVNRYADLPVLDASDIDSWPSPTWLLDGLIPQGGTGIFFGHAASYKSFLMLDVALRVATGTQWQGRMTVQGPVVYIAAEGATGLKLRINAWLEYHRLALPPGQLVVIPAAVRLAQMHAAEFIEHVTRELGGKNPVLIIVDTLAASAPGLEENSSKDMGLITAAARDLAQASGAALVLVHHETKEGGIRGSSALDANTDFNCQVRAGKQTATIKCPKQKDGAEVPTISLKLKACGGSLVVSHDVSAGAAEYDQRAQEATSLTKEQRCVLSVLAGQLGGNARNADWQRAAGDSCKRSPASFQRDLKRLAELGVIARAGTTDAPGWAVTSKAQGLSSSNSHDSALIPP